MSISSIKSFNVASVFLSIVLLINCTGATRNNDTIQSSIFEGNYKTIYSFVALNLAEDSCEWIFDLRDSTEYSFHLILKPNCDPTDNTHIEIFGTNYKLAADIRGYSDLSQEFFNDEETIQEFNDFINNASMVPVLLSELNCTKAGINTEEISEKLTFEWASDSTCRWHIPNVDRADLAGWAKVNDWEIVVSYSTSLDGIDSPTTDFLQFLHRIRIFDQAIL